MVKKQSDCQLGMRSKWSHILLTHPSTSTSSLHRPYGSITKSSHFLLCLCQTRIIIPTTVRSVCHLNINKCCFCRFAETTQTDILLRRRAQNQTCRNTMRCRKMHLCFSTNSCSANCIFSCHKILFAIFPPCQNSSCPHSQLIHSANSGKLVQTHQPRANKHDIF